MKLDIQLFAASKSTSFSESNISTANNTSSLTINIWFSANNQTTWFQSSTLYCTCNGSTQSQTVSHSRGGSVSASFTFNNIAHNPDGSKTVSWSWSCATGTSVLGTIGDSGNQPLTKIARQATIKSAPNFNDEENPTITYSNPLGNSANILQACISLTGAIDDIPYRNISKSGTSYTFELTQNERTILRQATTNNNLPIKFIIKTVINNSPYYSVVNKTMTIVNGNPVFSNFEAMDVNLTTVALTDDFNVNVNGYSNIRATISTVNKAVAQKEATMIKYRFVIEDKTVDIPYVVKYVCDGTESGIYGFTYNNINYQFTMPTVSNGDELKFNAKDKKLTLNDNVITTTNPTSLTGTLIEMEPDTVTGIIYNAPNGIYNVYAIDSRGNSTLVTRLASSEIAYEKISLYPSSCSVERNDNNSGDVAILKFAGKFWKQNFGVANNIIQNITYQFKKTTDTTWLTGTTSITPTINNDGTFEFEGQIASNNQDTKWDLQSAYDVKISISDYLSTTQLQLTPLTSATPHLCYADDGMAIMGDYDETIGGLLQVGGHKFDAIIESGANYILYSDDTLICFGYLSGTSPLSDYWANYKRSNPIAITFAKEFNSSPIVLISTGNVSGLSAFTSDLSTTGCNAYIIKPSGTTNTDYQFHYIAIGKIN